MQAIASGLDISQLFPIFDKQVEQILPHDALAVTSDGELIGSGILAARQPRWYGSGRPADIMWRSAR